MTNRTTRPARGLVFPAAVVLLLGLFIALLTYGLLSNGVESGIDDQLGRGRATQAPSFELPVLSEGRPGPALEDRLQAGFADGRLSLEELEGIPLIVNFWASWCPPCRTEVGLLQGQWRRSRHRGLLLLGINMQDVTADAREFLADRNLDYPSVRDRTDEVARRWGAVALPETYFVDARGRVVGHVIGVASEQQLRTGARAALTGRVSGRQGGGARRSTR
jgi:cytochrome c biogenesis protein CcmG/thiol:disulfide interchange protein DsbE